MALIYRLKNQAKLTALEQIMKKLGFILLVDDDGICNYLTERMLTRLDAAETIKTAINGDDAIRTIRQHVRAHKKCPDLILLDINMPLMNGIEFMKVISNYTHRDQCRVVVLTTSQHPSDIEGIKAFGIKEIYTKPITEQKLVEILKKVQEREEDIVDEDDETLYFDVRNKVSQ